MKIPDYILEKLEENFQLFEEKERLNEEVDPSRGSYLLDYGTQNEKKERFLYYALMEQEIMLREAISLKKRVIANRKEYLEK